MGRKKLDEEFVKVRNCLKCGEPFKSEGLRLCDDCNRKNQDEYIMHIVQIPKTVQVPTVE